MKTHRDSTQGSRGGACLAGALLVVALALFGALGLGVFFGAGQDDVFISLWQGKCLGEGLGFVNQNYEPAEVSSSFFHSCAIALLYQVSPEQLYLLNKLMGFGAGFLVLALMVGFRRHLFAEGSYPACALAVVFTATNPSFVYWSLGGLETPYVALLLVLYAGGATAYSREARVSMLVLMAVAGALLVATRPEGFYIILVSLAFVLIEWPLRGFRPALLLPMVVPLAVFALLTLWRLQTFGLLMPLPVYAKTGPMEHAIVRGARYLLQFYQASAFLMLAFAVAAVLGSIAALTLSRALREGRRTNDPPVMRHRYTLGLLLIVNVVVLLAGGDWMEYFRFLTPTVPLLAVVTFDAGGLLVCRAGMRWRDRHVRLALAGVCTAAIVLLAGSNLFQAAANQHGPGWVNRTGSNALPYHAGALFRDWAGLQERALDVCLTLRRDRVAIDPFIEEVLPKLHADAGRLVIVTNQMGYFPYRIRTLWPELDIRFIDLGGLCDPQIARLPLEKKDPSMAGLYYVDRVLAGATPRLSAYVRAQEPNMVYNLGYAPDAEAQAQRLAALGFWEVWRRPGARVYFRPAT